MLPLGPSMPSAAPWLRAGPQDLSPPLALPPRFRLLQAQRPYRLKYCILLLRTDCSTQAGLGFVKHRCLGKGWDTVYRPCGPTTWHLFSVLETSLCVLLTQELTSERCSVQDELKSQGLVAR